MFAYCLNNPVNMSDEYGFMAGSFYMADGGSQNKASQVLGYRQHVVDGEIAEACVVYGPFGGMAHTEIHTPYYNVMTIGGNRITILTADIQFH